MIVLGVDLSFSRSGFVWYDTASNKVIKYNTVTIVPGPRRLYRAWNIFRDTIVPDYILVDKLVVEGPALGVPNPRTLYLLGQLSGVFTLTAESYHMDPIVVPPTQVRKFICGRGNATKLDVSLKLRHTYKVDFDDDKGYDLSDAAACCLWGANA